MRIRTTLLVVLQVLVWQRLAGSGATSLDDDFVLSEFILERSLEVLAPTAPSIGNQLCSTQAVHYAKAVRKRVKWAVQMYDAGSKPPFSILSERGAHLGQYDQCVSLQDIPTEAGPISGRHCVVTIGAETWQTQGSIYQRMRLHVEEIEGKLRDLAGCKQGGASQAGSVQKTRGYRWSLCVPASCGPEDVRHHLAATLNGNTVGHVTCTSRADEHYLTAVDWLLMTIIVVLLNLVMAGTWRDFFPGNTGWTKTVLDAFSLRRGARQLFAASPPRAEERPSHVEDRLPHTEDRLPVLDGVRVLSMAVLFLYHHDVIRDHGPAGPPRLSTEEDIWLQRSRYAVILHVDTFVFLSGLLVCYNHMRDQRRGAKFKLLSFYFHRLVRLAPFFWLVVLFMRSNVQFYIGEGPLLKSSLQDHQRNCAENLPQVLMFLGNFLPPEGMCAVHSWYLAVDMQLYLIAPVFIIYLHSRPSVGKGLVACTLALSLVIAYLVTSHWPSFYMGIPYGYNVELAWYNTCMRLTPWLAGLGLGYALQLTALSPVWLSTVQVTAAWIVCVAMMTTALWMGPLILHWDNQSMTSLFVNLQQPMWVLGLAWVVFASSRGYGGCVGSLLSWRGFVVPSRLCYCFYLGHVIVIGLFASTVRTTEQSEVYDRMTYLLRDLVFSLLVATVAHLVVEIPTITLGRVLLQKENPSDKRTSRKKDK